MKKVKMVKKKKETTLKLKKRMKKRKIQNLKLEPSEKLYGNGKESMKLKLSGIETKMKLKKRTIVISINLLVKIMLIH